MKKLTAECDYTMPVLSEQERKAQVEIIEAMIKQIISDSAVGFTSDRYYLLPLQIALAALTAEPAVFEAEINGIMSSVTKSHFDDCQKYGIKTRKLYTAPPVPVKPEGEQ